VHTTTFTYLYDLPGGGTVADTPGVREFHPVVEADDLDLHFPEFETPSEECAYRNCTHINIDECGVLAAVERGEISRERHESYRILYESLKEGPRRGRMHVEGKKPPV
jgi:ribosome biogenesis GTPase